MMMNAVERVADDLFAADAHRVGNVKFFRGVRTDVTAEQLAAQLEHASAQVRAGHALRVDNIDGYHPQ